jgi:hypothetical protein
MRELHEKPVSGAVIYDTIPLHKRTKTFWRFLVLHNSWTYLRDRKQGGTNGTQWAGKYEYLGGESIKFDYIQILRNIRYCRENRYNRFQNHPENAVHISNLQWRLNLFKRGLYNPKTIDKILLKQAGY